MKLKINLCENDNCVAKPTRIMRLTSSHSHFQNPLRFRNRSPAKIAVCEDCADALMNSELKWAKEGSFNGTLDVEIVRYNPVTKKEEVTKE